MATLVEIERALGRKLVEGDKLSLKPQALGLVSTRRGGELVSLTDTVQYLDLSSNADGRRGRNKGPVIVDLGDAVDSHRCFVVYRNEDLFAAVIPK